MFSMNDSDGLKIDALTYIFFFFYFLYLTFCERCSWFFDIVALRELTKLGVNT